MKIMHISPLHIASFNCHILLSHSWIYFKFHTIPIVSCFKLEVTFSIPFWFPVYLILRRRYFEKKESGKKHSFHRNRPSKLNTALQDIRNSQEIRCLDLVFSVCCYYFIYLSVIASSYISYFGRYYTTLM